MEFKRISPTSASNERSWKASVTDGINALHDCYHAGQEAQRTWNEAADQKREVIDAKVDQIAGSVKTLTDLFSKGPPAVKAAMGWKEHAKLLLTVLGAGSGIAFFYKFGAAILTAGHTFLMGAS